MKICLFVLLAILASSAFGEATKCPSGSVLVELTISYSQERMEVCQKQVDGKYVKDGPEIIYNKDGTLKSTKYYKLDILTTETSSPVKIVQRSTQESKDIELRLHTMFDEMFSSLFDNNSQNALDFYEKGDIGTHGLCPESPEARLKFVLRGTPYINNIKFSSTCYYEGQLAYEFNKNLSVSLKVKENFDYTKLSFDYFVTKLKIAEKIKINTKITNGLFTLANDGKPVKFTASFSVLISPQEVLMSRGKKGLSIEEGVIDVIEFDGAPFSYHEDYAKNHLNNKKSTF